jgi:RNA polymerase sigma-70 factor, ECF subfamily
LGRAGAGHVALKSSTASIEEGRPVRDSERDRIFGEWLAGHRGILFKVVHAYAFEHADRQDLFQEIVIQVWRSVNAFRGDSSVPTWMYRVALNTAIAWTRKEGRHQRGKEPFEGMESLLTTSSSDGRDPRVEWLYHQIAQLKEVDRSVALLLLDGFSYKEIASIVGLTESNA